MMLPAHEEVYTAVADDPLVFCHFVSNVMVSSVPVKIHDRFNLDDNDADDDDADDDDADDDNDVNNDDDDDDDDDDDRPSGQPYASLVATPVEVLANTPTGRDVPACA